jgi:drug/metabolite transporter (DMT)-like permease
MSPLLAALITVVLWSAAFVGIRAAAPYFSPGALALGRLVIGSLCLGALLAARGAVRPTRRELLLLIVSGLTWFAIYNVVLNDAEHRVDAGTASMLVLLAPLVVIALAAAFLGEKTTPNLLTGAGIAFAGVAVIAIASGTHSATLLGVILCLLAACVSATGMVAQKPVLARLSSLQVTWTCCTIGAIACLPFAPALVRELRAAPGSGIGWLLFLGIFPTSVAFTTWAYALARGSAGRLAMVTYLIPPITVAISWLILREVPGLITVLGGAVCIAGVYFARRTPRAA